MRYILVFLIITIGLNTSSAQKRSKREIEITGHIIDQENNPVKGAYIFVDMVKTKAKTNRKGMYTLTTKRPKNSIAVYSPKMGLISQPYEKVKVINFQFGENTDPISEEEMVSLGYDFSKKKKKNEIVYSDYGTILEILDSRYPQVRIDNGRIIVGRGVHVFNADGDPLILVNKVPTSAATLQTIPTNEVASIRVVDKGSELSTYGMQAANGLIEISLKVN